MKKFFRVILEHFDIPATQLLGEKDLSLLGDNHLWCVASEHSRDKLDEKRWLFFQILICLLFWGSLPDWVSDPPVFHAAYKFWTKGMENLVLSWMVP